MALEKTTVVDLVSVQEADRLCRLNLCVEEGEWAEPTSAQRLTDKVDGYLQYALDGQLHRQYPRSKGMAIEIEVISVDAVPAWAEKLLRQWAVTARKHGVRLVVAPDKH